jgi:tetratricopeptide (TPR) repeat protein
MKALVGPDHRDIAAVMRYLGDAQRAYGQPAPALASFRAGLEVIRATEGGKPTLRAAIAQSNLAETLNTLGRPEEAMAEARQALVSFEQSVGLANPRSLSPRHTLVTALAEMGRLAEAETALNAARSAADPKDAAMQVRLDLQWAALQTLTGRAEAARELAQRASAQAGPLGTLDAARAGLVLASAELAAGNAAAAIDTAAPALGALQGLQDDASPSIAEARWLIGRAQLLTGRADKAEELLRQAKDAWQQLNPQSRMASRTMLDHALALRALGRTEEPARARAAAARMAESPFAEDRIVAAQWLASVSSNKAR